MHCACWVLCFSGELIKANQVMSRKSIKRYLHNTLIAGYATFFGSLLWTQACTAIGTDFTSELVATGLSNPVYVTHAPGDFDRVFIVEQFGTIRILDITQDPNVLLTAPFLDISTNITTFGSEQGLLGLAFHPDFQNNGFIYVNYTSSSSPSGHTVIARYTVPSGTPNDADETSEVILLTYNQPQRNHNGGWLSFGPDGYLYISSGDGGNFDDVGAGHTFATGNAQDITSNLLGKLLRIDVDGNDGPGGNYGIPPDNPFVGIEGDDEIWSYGLRNPWRCAFDSASGDLFIADVGQGNWEEIDFQSKTSSGGENWGWRCREGTNDFNFETFCEVLPLLDPIHEYSHGGSPFRCSITGGEMYRGCAIPALNGAYFFADFCSNQIWSLRRSGPAPTIEEHTTSLNPTGISIGTISSFGLDAYGEIYICDLTGSVYKIIPTGGLDLCHPSVPAVTTWGLLIITLGLMVIGTIILQQPKTHRSRV